MEYIIIQAGGKGTRLGYLTKNKPKALVPVDNLPMIFHLFRKYPDKRFVVIADYHKEVLREYLSCFAQVKYQVVDAVGTGTCSGIRQALKRIPPREPFMLVWSDLILPEGLGLPKGYGEPLNSEETIKSDAFTQAGQTLDMGIAEDYIGISQTFCCRWSYQNGTFLEERSTEHGVAGFFLFGDKTRLSQVPESGELVRWMQEQNLKFQEIGLAGTREFGILEEYEKLEQEKCRPFNRITVENGVLIKEAVDEQGRKLAVRERAWYEKAKELGIPILPQIYETNPLKMEYIKGKNIYECQLSHEEKTVVLDKLVQALHQLHQSGKKPADSFSMREANGAA